MLIRIIYMPQFDETSPINEICVFAFGKKKKKASKKKKKNKASSLTQ